MPNINIERAKALQGKLEQVSQLEERYAPKGVNFSVVGQEVHTTVSTASPLRDPEKAADVVIEMLKGVETLEAHAPELDAIAKTYKPDV